MAFLWFNIPPALFYLTETGMLALSLSLSVIAFLTDAVMYLPIIAFPLMMTTLSVILQLLWKKFFKRKLFIFNRLLFNQPYYFNIRVYIYNNIINFFL